MNKLVYSGLSILDLSKNVMYESYYIYKDIAEDVETRFVISNYEPERPLPKGQNKKVIIVMKGKLGGKIMKEFFGLRAKTYSYLIDDDSEDKKAKGTKICIIKIKIQLKIIKTASKQLNLKVKQNI